MVGGSGKAILGADALCEAVEICGVVPDWRSSCEIHMYSLGLDGSAGKEEEKGGEVEDHGQGRNFRRGGRVIRTGFLRLSLSNVHAAQLLPSRSYTQFHLTVRDGRD